MAIRITHAGNHAAQLLNSASQLVEARNQLYGYRSSIQTNWQGPEVALYTQAIDLVIARMNSAMQMADSLSRDMNTAGIEIEREEAAATAAAAALVRKNAMIEKAKSELAKTRADAETMKKTLEKMKVHVSKNAGGTSRTPISIKAQKELKEMKSVQSDYDHLMEHMKEIQKQIDDLA